MKSKKEILEAMHDEIFRSLIENEVSLRVLKDKKPDEVMMSKMEMSRMGPIQRNITAADVGKEEAENLEKNRKTLQVIEEMLVKDAERQRGAAAGKVEDQGS